MEEILSGRSPNPELTELYRQKLDLLRVNLTKDEPTRARATGLLRELVSDIEFYPIDGKGAARLKITGNMDAVVGLSNGRGTTAVSMVAEEGFEPPTRGL